MTPDLFWGVAERLGVPVAMLVAALAFVLRAWSKGDFVSRETHLAMLVERDKQLSGEIERRHEAERREVWWRDQWSEAAEFVKQQQEITATTQEITRDTLRPVVRRASRESGK